MLIAMENWSEEQALRVRDLHAKPSLSCFTCEAMFTLHADSTVMSSSILGPWGEGLSSEIAFLRLYWELSCLVHNDKYCRRTNINFGF